MDRQVSFLVEAELRDASRFFMQGFSQFTSCLAGELRGHDRQVWHVTVPERRAPLFEAHAATHESVWLVQRVVYDRCAMMDVREAAIDNQAEAAIDNQAEAGFPVTIETLQAAVKFLNLETDLKLDVQMLRAELLEAWMEEPEQREWIAQADGQAIGEWAASFNEDDAKALAEWADRMDAREAAHSSRGGH